MRKTLLLVFIHGFKGGDDTFGSFPEHLRNSISHALPNIDVVTITYPRYETRGELKECVTRFREWLQNKVIDIEVSKSAPSPMVDPSVHVILIGHSMGGIVAAETIILLANEQPIPTPLSSKNPEAPNFPSNTTFASMTSTSRPTTSTDAASAAQEDLKSRSFMFPHIQGLLTFDTPFLGLAPGMVAHSLEGGHKMVSNAFNTYNEVASIFGWGASPSAKTAAQASAAKSMGALPAATGDAAATPKWSSWGKYAMFAGAAGAVAAGGAAALYSQREKISAGWNWAGSHLLFVGVLIKAEELRKRVESVNEVCEERGIGAANFYTNLAAGAREGYGITATVAGKERTFCNLPVALRSGKQAETVKNNIDSKDNFKNDAGLNNPDSKSRARDLEWCKAINEKAKDETSAHTSMFFPRDNPGFYTLAEEAMGFVERWLDRYWYNTSDGKPTTTMDEEWVKPEPDPDFIPDPPEEIPLPDDMDIEQQEYQQNNIPPSVISPSSKATVAAGNTGVTDPHNTQNEWASLERPKDFSIHDDNDDAAYEVALPDDNNDVKMHDEDNKEDADGLRDSVIVDKAGMPANSDIEKEKEKEKEKKNEEEMVFSR